MDCSERPAVESAAGGTACTQGPAKWCSEDTVMPYKGKRMKAKDAGVPLSQKESERLKPIKIREN